MYKRKFLIFMSMVLAVVVLSWGIDQGWAQTQTPPTPQFDVLGFIQEATLGVDPDTGLPVCTPTDPRLAGGTMKVNGIKMIVPCNTILQLPAATMTWADLFNPLISAPVGTVIGTVPVQVAGQTRLALTDIPMPFPSFEVRVQGNVVNGQYIVGLIVPITQQGLNASSGLISFIDYTTGAFRVGGIIGDPNCTQGGVPGGGPLCSGALVQVNDPVGRWGLVHSIDPRYSGDFENTTVHASTGIPVCIPRVAPPSIDPLCPLKNRPLNNDTRFGAADPFLASTAPRKIFDMPTPAAAELDLTLPDPRQQVPMMVGDQVNYAGTLYKIDPAGLNTAANTYISAHTLEDVLGIFTAPGVPPAYVFVEAFLIGTGGAAVQGIAQEASTRLTVVGFTTDPTRKVEIYAQDINACTGQESLRLLAITDPATQPVRGRFVHRVLGGLFMPPTRNYVMKSQTQALDPLTGQRIDLIAANGILTGQFLLPNFEFIFPENHRFGDPILPFNFQDLPFLAQGSGPVDGFGSGTAVVGQLAPWPGVSAPSTAACGAQGAQPIVNAGPDVAAATGAQVGLFGTVTWDSINSLPASRTTQWVQTFPTCPDPLNPGCVTLLPSPTNNLTPNFIAPATPQTLSFQLQAIDNITGVTPATDQALNPTPGVNIIVLAPADIVQITAATWVNATGKKGGFGKLNVTATSSDPTAILSLTEIGTDTSVTNWGTGVTSPPTPGVYNWVENKGAPQPASLTVTSSKGGSATTGCGAPTGTKGTVTCP